MAEPSDDRIGTLIDGRYQVTEVMASGAMGSVYKAERVPVGKLVAVKFLHASFASDTEFQARFERETRVMSKLNHPNCVSVLDFGVWQGAPYLVMDYVDGVTLRTRLDKVKTIAPLEALNIARQVLAGLAHAHSQDVYHRDVKPANIMISEEIGHGERVRILDFGLARLQGNVGRDATQTNVVVGTPNYMAPEQTVPGTTIDARTDLYAVGVVLYEMIVGERPFNSEDTLQLLGMHRAAPVPKIEDRVPPGLVELPIGLQDIVDKAMAKSPKDRYQTAIEFAKAIDEVAAGKLDPMEIDATLPKMKSGPVISPASTLELGATLPAASIVADLHEEPPPKRRGGFLGALILLGGTTAMAGYLITRNQDKTTANEKPVEDPVVVVTPDADTTIANGSATGVTMPAVEIDAGAVAIVESDAAVAAVVELDAGVATIESDAGTGSNGVNEEEIQIDPAVAEDPDINAGSASPPEDEEENAPKTEAEVEKREKEAPPAPTLARTVHDAVVMIKQGKKALALTSLRKLWKQQPNSGYIPFLLGNLYFDKQWWSVSLDHYRAAIKKNQGYRKNHVLNRNVIRMLASTKTRQSATNFLRGVIGGYAKPHLRSAAKNEKNPVVRKHAANLARYIR